MVNAVLARHYTDYNPERLRQIYEEACQLIESGFEYVTEMDDIKLFRKRK